MNTFVKMAAVVLLTSYTMAFADELQIIALDQLTEQEALQFLEEEGNTVIEVQEGLRLPVSFFLTGELLELSSSNETDLSIIVQQTFFIKHDSSGFLFSLDLSNWYSLEEFVAGQISAEIQLDKGYPELRFIGELNSRLSRHD